MPRKYSPIGLLIVCIGWQSCNHQPKAKVTTPQKTLTVFALTPAVTEIAFAVCTPEQIEMVCKASDFPVAAKKLPAISTLPIDVEALAQNPPSLILAEDGIHSPKAIEDLKQRGFTVKTLHLASIEDLWISLDSLGLWTGNISNAKRVKKDVQAAVQPYRNRFAASNKSVAVVFYMNPFMAYGTHNWMDAKLRFLGLKNAFAAKEASFLNLTTEELVQTPMNYLACPPLNNKSTSIVEELKKWQPDLKIIHLNEDLASRPSTRLPEQLADICKAIDAKDSTKTSD